MAHARRVRPPRIRARHVVAAALLFAVSSRLPPPAHAQDVSNAPGFLDDASTWEDRQLAPPMGHVSLVDGSAALTRDGETLSLDENEPLVEGDHLATDRGRVQLLLTDGSLISLDEGTSLEILGPAFVRLIAGRLAINVTRRAAANDYRVDANGIMVWLRPAGEYRVSATGDTSGDVHIATLRGAAEVEAPRDRVAVRAGYETVASAQRHALVTRPVPVTLWTAFDRWIEWNERSYMPSASSSYLPADLRVYTSVLDSYGAWQYESDYGYVWYPAVDRDWQPYSIGRWSSIGHFGWTWIGSGRWAWPTHHYGRWGYSGTRWYWIPGQRWAPAWVTWASSPGYVAWCPVGYAGGPRVSVGVRFPTWRGWSVVPSRTFAIRTVYVQRDRVPFNRVNERFVVRAGSPTLPVLRANTNSAPRTSGQPPRTAQPRQGYGVGPAPRTPGLEPRASRVPRAGDAPPQSSPAPGRRPPSRDEPVTTEPTAPRRPSERYAVPRFPSRTLPPSATPYDPPRSPQREPEPAARPGRPTERPESGGAVRSRRPEPDSRPAPPSEPRPGRTGPREPAAGPAPRQPEAPSRPESVERSAPRQRGGGSEGPGQPGSGRAVPRSEPRGGSRGR